MILFVASNPSRLNLDSNVPFKGSKSEKNFNEWAARISPLGNHEVMNVLDNVTEDNRPLTKAEIEEGVFGICERLKDGGITKVVTLGKSAQLAIEMSQSIVGPIDYYALPHPSPRNRFLNNKEQVEAVLEECEKWVRL